MRFAVKKGRGDSPTPDQIVAARKQAGLSREEAARLVYCKERAWQEWELGNRNMHQAVWELFRIRAQGEKSRVRM